MSSPVWELINWWSLLDSQKPKAAVSAAGVWHEWSQEDSWALKSPHITTDLLVTFFPSLTPLLNIKRAKMFLYFKLFVSRQYYSAFYNHLVSCMQTLFSSSFVPATQLAKDYKNYWRYWRNCCTISVSVICIVHSYWLNPSVQKCQMSDNATCVDNALSELVMLTL